MKFLKPSSTNIELNTSGLNEGFKLSPLSSVGTTAIRRNSSLEILKKELSLRLSPLLRVTLCPRTGSIIGALFLRI